MTVPAVSVSAPSSAPPVAPPVQHVIPPAQQVIQQQEPVREDKGQGVMSEQAAVSAPPQELPRDLPVVSKEERIEYRDENGRVLDDEEVAALAGKVSFKTRYETRTRVIDGQGKELYEGLVDAHDEAEEHGSAGTIAEGSNPETQAEAEAPKASAVPPVVEVEEDQQKERHVEEQSPDVPKPASEAPAATQEEQPEE